MKAFLFELFGVSSITQIPNKYGWIAVFFSIFLFWPNVGFMPVFPQTFYYFGLGAFSLWVFSNLKNISIIFTILLLYIPVNILISNPPPIFHAWGRCISFVLLIICTSSFAGGNKLIRFRFDTFHLVLILCAILGSASFICWFLGINYMGKFSYPAGYNVGSFGGLFHHSMQLGPISAIGAIYGLYKFLMSHNKLFLIVFVMCTGSVLFSASRASLISMVIGVTVLFYQMSRSSKNIVGYIVILVALVVFSYPFWAETFKNGILKKNGGPITEISTSSRDSKWESRLSEFSSNPVFGVGFCAVDLQNGEDYTNDGKVESGSSWLSVFSMTGIIGSAIILAILLKSFFRVYRLQVNSASLISSVIVFLVIHMMAEGYIFAGGSLMGAIFWLTIGVAIDFKNLNYISL